MGDVYSVPNMDEMREGTIGAPMATGPDPEPSMAPQAIALTVMVLLVVGGVWFHRRRR